jgi:soluble lytic murein transglycosylase
MKFKIATIFTLCFIGLLLCGCDSKRNQLILGFFFTQTPVPPTATWTPEPTQTATPIPTPLPEFRIQSAEEFMLAGDYDRAWSEYEKIRSQNPREEYVAASIFGESRIAFLRGKFDQCQSILTEGLKEISGNENQSRLWYQKAECYQASGQWLDELDALRKFLEISPDTSLIFDVLERQGDAFYALEEYSKAAEQYLSALTLKTNNSVKIKLADTYYAQELYSEAFKVWLEILSSSASDQQKANICYRMGKAYLQIGSKEQAYSQFQEAVNQYPRYYDSYASLLILLENNQPVNEFQRGLVNYYMQQYALASESFYRYIAAEPNHDGSAYYYIGLCQMYMAEYEAAITSFQKIIDEYPNNRFYVSAWDEKAYIQWTELKRYDQAAQTLIQYASKHPDQPDAANFIFEAGRILERGNHLSDAAKQWERLIDEYPLYEKSSYALFLSGLSRFRIKSYDSALATLNRLLLLSTEPEELARAHFWIAKVYAEKGEKDAADRYFHLAAEDDPSDFYSERASDILSNKAPFEFSQLSHLEVNLRQERQIADQWMRLTFNLSSDIVLDQPDELLLNSTYKAANELWNLGQYQEAINQFDQIRLEYVDDPVNSYRLLNRLVDLGAWRPAVFTSRQILTAAGLIEDVRTLSAPNYFNHIRYCILYPEIINDTYETYKIHPFILYGLMRQESMYDPWISSSAGAIGLMQIMPSTGLEISKNLHWPPDYTDSDLQRALVAINFSGYYLERQFSYHGGSYFYMLAAYNAGPGNTAQWIELANDDPDLFYEVIRFEETRNYIEHVYEFSKMYERLYTG